MVEFLSSQTGLLVVACLDIASASILTLLLRPILQADTDGTAGSAGMAVANPSAAALAGLICATALLVPLVFTIASADVFVLPKITALRVALIAGLALFLAGRENRINARSSPLLLRIVDPVLVGYAVLTCIATVVSIDPGLSLVGRPEQYQGLATTLLYIAFFYLAREALATDLRLWILAGASVAGGAIAGGYAVLQKLHLDPIWNTLAGGRAFSTIGQAEWLGAYFVICLALGAGLLWHVRSRWRWAAVASVGIIFIGLLLTLSRGAYLGLVVAGAVFAVTMTPGAHPTRRWLWALPVLVVALGTAIAFAPIRNEAQLMLTRAASTTDLTEGSIVGRLDLWQVGVADAVDHPFLGTGPETYTEIFPQYRDRMIENRRQFWLAYSPESPHNVYLAIADGAGLPALAAYLILIGASLVQLARNCARAPSRETRAMLAGMLAAAAGHLVTDLFMTADVTASWLFWVLLGAAVGYAERVARKSDRQLAATVGKCRNPKWLLSPHQGDRHRGPVGIE